MSAATLRLKMSVESVKRVAKDDGTIGAEEIALRAVNGVAGSANNEWSMYTPNGQLTMTVTNPAAHGRVLPGQYLFVDLIPTDKDS